MEISNLVDEIMSAYESESELEYGSPQDNQYIRDRGIRAKIWDILFSFESEVESRDSDEEHEETWELEDTIEELNNEILDLRKRIKELEEE